MPNIFWGVGLKLFSVKKACLLRTKENLIRFVPSTLAVTTLVGPWSDHGHDGRTDCNKRQLFRTMAEELLMVRPTQQVMLATAQAYSQPVDSSEHAKPFRDCPHTIACRHPHGISFFPSISKECTHCHLLPVRRWDSTRNIIWAKFLQCSTFTSRHFGKSKHLAGTMLFS